MCKVQNTIECVHGLGSNSLHFRHLVILTHPLLSKSDLEKIKNSKTEARRGDCVLHMVDSIDIF